MGDMKTPDFDDLLAAFDIPDPDLDGKEASHEEGEGHLKQAGMGIDDLSLHQSIPASDVPVVSVIVKNTSRQESFDSTTEKDCQPLGPSLLQNGFRNSDITADPHGLGHNYNKLVTAFINGDSARSFTDKFDLPRTTNLPTFSQFSPISSPEPEDGLHCGGMVDKMKHDDRPYLISAGLYSSAVSSVLDTTRKQPEQAVTELSMFDEYSKKREKVNEIQNCKATESHSGHRTNTTSVPEKAEQEGECFAKSNHFFEGLSSSSDLHSSGLGKPQNSSDADSSTCSSVPPQQRLKSAHSKFSSCLAALVALNSKRVVEIPKEEQTPNCNSKDSPLLLKDGVKGSPKMPKSPKSPRSPMEAVRKLLSKPPDSPRSVSSDYSSKGSPSVTGSSPPAIPRVRIKTIKTSSGEITRTVTRIMPDSEQSETRSSPEQSMAEISLTEELSLKASPGTLASMQTHISAENGKRSLCAKSLAAAVSSLSSIPVKVTGSQLFNEKLEGSRNLKAMPVCEAPLDQASSAIRKAASEVQKQAGRKQMPNVSSSSLLPKTVHLASLNLVPHSVAANANARSSKSRPKMVTQALTVPLVQSEKKPVSLPSESPTAVQSIVVESFNKLLNSINLVPTYTPNLKPPPDSSLSLPARGYRCLECGDAFALEKSLAQHHDRRSVHIEVMCSHCSKQLVFFNKCGLLTHAREHKSKGMVMQCSQLLMKPIPPNQMFSSSTSTVTACHPVPASTPAAHVPGSLTVIGTGSSAANQPAMPLRSDPLRLIRHGLKCLECYEQFQDCAGLAAHYQLAPEDTDLLPCRICHMMLPNKCSYTAHLRIHTHKSPYCCPECGSVCRSAYFQTHVKNNCLHYARTVAYRCIYCRVMFNDLSMLKTHIQVSHCEYFHKCTVCPMAFKTPQSANSHYANQHPLVRNRAAQVIFKCSMCETVFNQRAMLHKHFEQHKNKLIVCVYKCPVCQSLYLHKQLMMEHFKDTHGVGQNMEDLPNVWLPSREASSSQVPKPSSTYSTSNGVTSSSPSTSHRSSEPRVRGKNPGWTCGECLQWLPDRELYVSHMKRTHGKSMKRYPCRQCDHSFNASHSLRRHIRTNHNSFKRTYTCWYCTDEKHFFAKRFLLEKHINLMHGIRNPDFSQMPKAVATSGDSTESVSGKRVPMESEADEPGSPDCEATTPKKLKVSVSKSHRCSKCGYETEDNVAFLRHIAQHKTDGSTSQCPQCGLCYTSTLSLNRHLYIVHKIKETEEKPQPDLVNENGQEEHNGQPNTTDEEEEEEEEGEGEEGEGEAGLQCRVCRGEFETETALSAHVRTHGMRFIMSQQNGGTEQ